MAENATATAGSTGTGAQPATQPQPGAGAGSGGQGQGAGDFKAPVGYRLVADQDYQNFERYGQQVRGMHGTVEKIKGFGFESPDAMLEQLSPLFTAAKERKIDLRSLAQVLTPAQQRQTDRDANDPKLTDEEREERLMARLEERQALTEHQRSLDPKSLAKLVDEQVAALVGADADEATKELYREAAYGRLLRDRYLDNPAAYSYPEGHRLHGTEHRQWFSPDNTKAHWEYLQGLRKKHTGATLAGIGDASNRAPAKPSAAAQGGGHDKPATNADDKAKQRTRHHLAKAGVTGD